MFDLSNSKLSDLKALVRGLNDVALSRLNTVLEGHIGDDALAAARDVVWVEFENRRIQALVFSPVIALCPRQAPAFSQTRFPSDLPHLLMDAMGNRSPRFVKAAVALTHVKPSEVRSLAAYDSVCTDAAVALRAADPHMAPVLACLRRDGVDRVEEFARYLDLCPIMRGLLVFLPRWMRQMSPHRAATVRATFRDACEIAPDAAPRFFEMLYCGLSEPWMVLRILSAVMNRPLDTYVAGTEIAMFGERLLERVDQGLNCLRSAPGQGGARDGLVAAEAAQTCAHIIAEFEQGLTLTDTSLWGQRIGWQKTSLTGLCAKRIAEAEKLLSKALPMTTTQLGRRPAPSVPRLAIDPDPTSVQELKAALTFLMAVRSTAGLGGFGSIRSKTLSAVQTYLNTYAEGLLERLGTTDEDAERVMAFLDVAAVCLGCVFDDMAEARLRKRAATASLRQMTQAGGVA
jgi:hypothetical protein